MNSAITLVGFTDHSTVQVTKAVALKLKVDFVELVITLYVIDALSECDILIGRNFTEDTSIMYTRIGGTLTFQPVADLQVLKIDTYPHNTSFTDHETILNKIFSKYPQCLSRDSTVGKTNCVELEIELISNKPVCQRPYRMSESQRTIVREIIDELLKNGIIRNSSSAFASPALLVDKSSGAKEIMCRLPPFEQNYSKRKIPNAIDRRPH